MKKKQKLGPLQRKWVKALRSGRYKQTKGKLHVVRTDASCCLGVACRILRIPKEKISGHWAYGIGVAKDAEGLLLEVRMQLGLVSMSGAFMHNHNLKSQPTLAGANDNGATFSEIADFIEAHPEAVFTASK